MRLRSAFPLLVAITAAACSTELAPSLSAPASASPSPTAPASAPPSGADSGSGPVIATFQTAGDEQFRILLTDPQDIRIARRVLEGRVDPIQFPNGLIVRGDDGGVNVGYSWHIDPDSVQFAEFTTEVCDGRPSYVEDGTHPSDRFCPWSAVVVAIEPAG
jgi:hypothetical protein